MRACTAVVTELSYNESDDEQTRYKADVEFIKPQDCEAGVAYAKIRAVYPSKTRDQLAEGGLEALMRVTAVNNILGTTKHIAEAGSARFYQKLQTYVDSQEKATGREKKDEPRRMEYWPLIKVVKIYTKADALSTGAVLVDLPGVHDSNAARAAVAEGYMKQCTGLWIVAPITRAVDDKAAKSLLGDSFKRQLKLDGTYGNVTFICSKTDDISIQEAVQSLDLDETAERSWAESDELKNEAKRLKDKVKDCKESKAVFSGVIDECDDDIEAWEALSDQLADGKTVYEPVEKTNKRKRTSSKSGPQKKRRTTDSDDDFIDDDSEAAESSASDESETEDEVDDRQPLSAEEIDAKIQELRSKKKNAKNQREELDKQTKTLNKEIKALNEKIAAIDHEVGSLCIKGRNDYSRGAIQQDFAAGIKELDQETALDEDEENFNPDEDFRDYDEVARSLPVFCISSRAFQKLSGRLKRDKDVSGFKDIQETGMPQLQAHSKKLTEAGRAANSQKFLNNLSQLLNSIALWATQNDHGSQLTASQQRKEAQFLEQKLAELYDGLDKVVDDTLAGIRDNLTENIYDKYDRAVTTAGWERTFQRVLPRQMDNFKVKTLEVLKDFHIAVTKRANEIGVSIASIAMLSQQLNNYGPFLEAQVHTMKELMTTFQREVNREFTPVIAAAMEHAYDLCASECGTGTYVRMKGHMASHISANRTKMFQDACNAVKKSLEQMSAHIKTQLEQRTDGVYSTAQRDYLQVLGNIGAADIPLSQVEIGVREDVASILDSSEGTFRRIVEGEDDDEASVQPEESEGMNVDSDEPTRANDMVDGLEEERPARGDSYASEPPERDHKSSLASEGSKNWETDGTLIGSDEKENAGSLSDKVGFGNETADTVPAERAILKTLDTNF
ncbi:putative tat pathway signal sequence protein [Neofusicoccum parvum UCRNP2]|uniref:Putative tat pathway signal sequence protein n=1 Tax=Botryosphaeria parva (strain UCR-NP2) TaxID=1287680 RepID=R1EHT4_BOTPV|nr:putative tat pathway signal sequence protein [Neofusicoccum parvum UCRNP2]